MYIQSNLKLELSTSLCSTNEPLSSVCSKSKRDLRFWPHFVDYLSQTQSCLMSKNSCLAPNFGVTKFIKIIAMNFVTLCCDAEVRLFCSTKASLLNKLKSDLDFNKVLFVEQKPMLSSKFRCDQIHNNHCHEFCHTLL